MTHDSTKGNPYFKYGPTVLIIVLHDDAKVSNDLESKLSATKVSILADLGSIQIKDCFNYSSFALSLPAIAHVNF